MGSGSGKGVGTPGDFGLLNWIGYRALCAFAWLTIRPYFRIRLEGAEHLPKGPFIIAPNHTSYIDPVVLQVALPRRVLFMMTLKWYRRPVLNLFFRFMHCIAVDEVARSNRKALQSALDALGAGASVGIFPEGEISTDGRPGEFVPGVVSLALRAGVPVVPAAIEGAFAAMPKGKTFPRPARITVRVGRPLFAGGRDGTSGRARREVLREATAELKQAVTSLLDRTRD